jgi:hypothetical protein
MNEKLRSLQQGRMPVFLDMIRGAVKRFDKETTLTLAAYAA